MRAVTAAPHWADAYYGELYLRSVEDLLTPRLSALEADAIAALLDLRPGDRVLDLACGHGRHARRLAGRARAVVGLDRSGPYLRRALRATAGVPEVRPGAAVAWVCGDVRALPFRTGSFDAAFSWYASLFMFDDPTNAACLAEAARVVRRGGRLLVHHANPLKLAREPVAAARRALPDGSLVVEESSYDARTGVDRCARRVERPDGAVLAGTAELRYYIPSEWSRLAESAGLLLLELTTTPEAGRSPRREPGPDAPDLIALLEKK
ncbi:MAG TPA: class I SAM-dependent methyltransferase [Anaeromyxobacter sp.]